jgi:hypothetical protein
MGEAGGWVAYTSAGAEALNLRELFGTTEVVPFHEAFSASLKSCSDTKRQGAVKRYVGASGGEEHGSSAFGRPRSGRLQSFPTAWGRGGGACVLLPTLWLKPQG